MIIGANTDNPDTVAMVALKTLSEGLQLYLTDNAWSNIDQQFRTNEGVLTTTLSQDVSRIFFFFFFFFFYDDGK